jgi:outer membrane protein W
MRTMLKVVAATLLLAAVASAPAKAQGQWFYGLGYQVSIPLSNTKDFTENVSWRGASFEARKAIKPNLTVGLSLGWHVFDEETDEVVSFDNLDVSGDQLRYINSFPILLNAHKYFGQEGSMRPFVGLNAGGYVMEHRLEIGLVALEETNFHIGFAPELGFVFPLEGNSSIYLSGRYNYAFSAGNVDDQSYVGVTAGYAWSNW